MVTFIQESDERFADRARTGEIKRARFFTPPSQPIRQALAEGAVSVVIAPPLANGRIELCDYLREISLSIDYHRYGNLGVRENEKRTPVL